VGPDYQRPSAPVAAKWDTHAPWREGTPRDGVPKGEWWQVFRNQDLDVLEKQALAQSQTLKISLAHLEQARAMAAIQVAALFPTVRADPSFERQRLSGNRPSNGVSAALQPAMQNTFNLPFTVSYEIDLFGRRRRAIEAAEASYQANAADQENVRLLLTSQLAGDYFNLRQIDSELGILNRTVDALQKGLDVIQTRHHGGAASGLDLAEEETLLQTTRTQAVLLLQRRKQIEDAIAVLVGQAAPTFHLPSKELSGDPPSLAAGLPSDLLERRPDIAEAERQMAAANAQIGVARAAYYPSVSLLGQAGWQSVDVANLFSASSVFWALGANVAQNIFQGGALGAQVQFAQAGYDASVANYRQVVLGAFQEVQDEVTGIDVLHQALLSQQLAIDAAKRTLAISTDRYTGGLVSYLDVVTAQQNLLTNERQLADIKGQRLVASVLLVKALGGGWDAASLAAVQARPTLKDAVSR
jgi:NodT family efflux transporter outer membrane factor (OMF) lipoprotein